MAELHLDPFHPKVPVNFQNIEIASFRLLSIFLSDKEYQKLRAKNELAIPDEIYARITFDRIIHSLIEIAIFYRIQDNQCPKTHEFKKARKTRIVGILYEPIGSEEQPLDMREACNKIIHARDIRFDVKKLPKLGRAYLNPKIYIYGERHNTEWKTIIDVIRFCEYAIWPLEIDAAAYVKVRKG